LYIPKKSDQIDYIEKQKINIICLQVNHFFRKQKALAMLIHEMTRVDDEIVQAFQNLIPQLTESSPSPTKEDLEKMADSETAFVFLAREEDVNSPIVGTATLALFQTPTGMHGWIEDVVVDKEFRHRGVGRALTESCLQKARELSLHQVNLTSRPSRKAANQLYQSMGFVLRETNLYTILLEKPKAN